MGKDVANIELVSDYSTEENCLRLHIDLSLSAAQMEKFRTLMNAGDHAGAFRMVRESSDAGNRDLIDSFEAAFDAIARSRRKVA